MQYATKGLMMIMEVLIFSRSPLPSFALPGTLRAEGSVPDSEHALGHFRLHKETVTHSSPGEWRRGMQVATARVLRLTPLWSTHSLIFEALVFAKI